MSSKRLIFTSTISLILVFLLLVSTTYSIFTTGKIEEEANVYKTGLLDITYTLSDDNIKLQSDTPFSVDDLVYLKPYRIIVSNNGNTDYKFNLILNNTTATNTINSEYIMVQVGKNKATKLSEYKDNIIKSDIIIKANSSLDIDIRVFLAKEIPNSEVGKNFSATISIIGQAISNVGSDIDNTDLVCEYLEKHSIIDLKKSISDENRTYTSKDKTGLYYTKNNTSYGEKNAKIYYYSGIYNEVNNWVIFGKNSKNQDMCFRIIRTTLSGGTKMIYSGIANNGNCSSNTYNSDNLISSKINYNNKDNNAVYVLWQGVDSTNNVLVDDFANLVDSLKINLNIYEKNTKYDSVIKNNVRDWYYTNIVNTGYKSYLENMNLCIELGDKKFNKKDNNYYFVDYNSNIYHPTYNCSIDNTVVSKYGILTRDETIYGGLNTTDETSSNWLISKDNYWTISPSYVTKDNISYVSYISNNGKIDNAKSLDKLGVRPVISLKKDVVVKSGDGSISKPYIIDTD